jgi:SAM-dependent methyltransferase
LDNGYVSSLEIRKDWYRFSYGPEMDEMPWAEKTNFEVDRILTMLKPRGDERILDLGCGTGRHTLALTQRGFSVVGVELLEVNVAAAEDAARAQGLQAEFVPADLRDLDYDEEFDIVVNLNDGGLGYFESDDENLRTFEVVARALRRGGRHLAQTPNRIHAERFFPTKTWIEGTRSIELIDYDWNGKTERMEGNATLIPVGEVFEGYKPVAYGPRLYLIEELEEIYASFGMTLTNTFRGSGKPGRPRDNQFEIFWEATKS